MRGRTVADEVRLQRLGLVDEGHRTQSRLEGGAVEGDADGQAAHRGEATEIDRRELPKMGQQLVLDAGRVKLILRGIGQAHGHVVEQDEPHLGVLQREHHASSEADADLLAARSCRRQAARSPGAGQQLPERRGRCVLGIDEPMQESRVQRRRWRRARARADREVQRATTRRVDARAGAASSAGGVDSRRPAADCGSGWTTPPRPTASAKRLARVSSSSGSAPATSAVSSPAAGRSAETVLGVRNAGRGRRQVGLRSAACPRSQSLAQHVNGFAEVTGQGDFTGLAGGGDTERARCAGTAPRIVERRVRRPARRARPP